MRAASLLSVVDVTLSSVVAHAAGISLNEAGALGACVVGAGTRAGGGAADAAEEAAAADEEASTGAGELGAEGEPFGATTMFA